MAYLVSRDKVPDKEQDIHDDMLCDGGSVRASDLQDVQALLGSSIEVDVVRSNTSRDTDFEVLGLQNVVEESSWVGSKLGRT